MKSYQSLQPLEAAFANDAMRLEAVTVSVGFADLLDVRCDLWRFVARQPPAGLVLPMANTATTSAQPPVWGENWEGERRQPCF